MRLCYQTFKVTMNEAEMLLIFFFILKLLVCEALNFYIFFKFCKYFIFVC